MSALRLKTELLPVFSGDPSSHSSSTASGVPEGEVPGRSSVVILHHILRLQHRGLGRMRSVTLRRLAVQAAEPLMEPMSGLAELLPADGGVQLRLDALADHVPAQVLAGDLTHGAVGAGRCCPGRPPTSRRTPRGRHGSSRTPPGRGLRRCGCTPGPTCCGSGTARRNPARGCAQVSCRSRTCTSCPGRAWTSRQPGPRRPTASAGGASWRRRQKSTGMTSRRLMRFVERGMFI